MVLALPARISLSSAAIGGAALTALLFAEGNPPGICITIFALILVWIAGFNIAGGFRHPNGSYIFFVVLFTGLLGVGVKAVTNEPLLANVPNADQMLLVYLVGTCGMVAAAYLARRLAVQKPFLAGRLTHSNTSQVVMGCVLIGIFLPIAIFLFARGLASITRQLNVTLPLAVLIGVYQRTRETGGRSSFTWVVFVAWAYATWIGIASFSKEQMFTPTLAWIIAAAAARLRVSALQLITAVPLLTFAIMILVPYSLYGRNFRGTGDTNAPIRLLSHPLELRAMVNAAVENERDLYHWFNEPRGIFDRLTLIPIDSALIRRTDAIGPIGLNNVYAYLQNIVPHFILPNKPDIHSGNDYAHEIGMLAEDDHSTGISFSPYADAYHQAGWLGVIVVMPGILFLLFFVMDAVTGSSDDSPWALFFIMAFGHLAAEGMLIFPVYAFSTGAEAVIATAFLMIYVTPTLGALILGPGRSSSNQPVKRPVAPRSRLPGRAVIAQG